jgi:hypothetical protein
MPSSKLKTWIWRVAIALFGTVRETVVTADLSNHMMGLHYTGMTIIFIPENIQVKTA